MSTMNKSILCMKAEDNYKNTCCMHWTAGTVEISSTTHNELINVILINSTNQLGIVISVLLLLCTQSMPDHHVWINKNKSQRSFPFQKTHSTLWFTCVCTAILNTTQAHYMLTRHFDMMFLKQAQPIFTLSADRLMYRIFCLLKNLSNAEPEPE